MMNESERLQLDADVTRIQQNARAWLMRRNYMELRRAALSLQHGMAARAVCVCPCVWMACEHLYARTCSHPAAEG